MAEVRGKRNRSGNRDTVEKNVEIPRYTLPSYLANRIDDLSLAAPGHKFLLYFQGASYKATVMGGSDKEANKARDELAKRRDEGKWNEIYKKHIPNANAWDSIKDSKRASLSTVTQFPADTAKVVRALISRQRSMADKVFTTVFKLQAEMTSPVAIGLGNPHPVENGFSFLSPYGIPYLPASGIKGAVRRAAEELALFDESSDWTISIVWLLFGFEGTSGYLTASKQERGIDVLMEEGKRWREAFSKYAEERAESDKLLRHWLSLKAVKSSIPKELQGLAEQPAEFCKSLQSNDKLRKAISWQGFIRFWDAFFDTDSLEVDILNPHHKDYYEGEGSPHDAESPKPVFFLTVPAGTAFTIYCQLVPRADEALPIGNWRDLIKEAVDHACEWVGFGAKTAVGYGVGCSVEADENSAGKQNLKEMELTQDRECVAGEENKGQEEFEKLPEYKRIVMEIQDPSTIENVIVDYYNRIDEFQRDEQREIAEALKKRWIAENKWKQGSKKQKVKVKKIKEILGET